jgi:hypothetical protein
MQKVTADKYYMRKYRKENPEKVRKHIQKWRDAHKDQYRIYQLEYYHKNKEKICARNRLRRKK